MDKEQMIETIYTGEKACMCLVDIISRLVATGDIAKVQDILDRYFKKEE